VGRPDARGRGARNGAAGASVVGVAGDEARPPSSGEWRPSGGRRRAMASIAQLRRSPSTELRAGCRPLGRGRNCARTRNHVGLGRSGAIARCAAPERGVGEVGPVHDAQLVDRAIGAGVTHRWRSRALARRAGRVEARRSSESLAHAISGTFMAVMGTVTSRSGFPPSRPRTPIAAPRRNGLVERRMLRTTWAEHLALGADDGTMTIAGPGPGRQAVQRTVLVFFGAGTCSRPRSRARRPERPGAPRARGWRRRQER
jgi:hypothetical protein